MCKAVRFTSLVVLGSLPLMFALLPRTYAASISPALGWSQHANTPITNVCAGTHGFPEVLGAEGCKGIFAWSGGVFDTKRNRLIVWGGGHNAYYGNELYAFDLDDLTMTRLNDPGLPLAISQEEIASGTQPNSRHTYDGIAYMANVDRMFVFGGSLGGNGYMSRGTWTFNFATMRWQQMNPAGPIPAAVPGITTAYDPNTGLVFLFDRCSLYSYNFSTDTYTRLHSDECTGYHMAATIDPKRKRFFLIGYDSAQGSGRVYWYDISPGSSYARQTMGTTGGSAIVDEGYPGLAYDPVSSRIVGWAGGDSAYTLDQNTGVWSAHTFGGGPGPGYSTGTHGRWDYSPTSGVFVLVNTYNQDAYTFRMNSGAVSTPPASPTGLQVR